MTFNDPTLGPQVMAVDEFMALWQAQGRSGMVAREELPPGVPDPMLPLLAGVAGMAGLLALGAQGQTRKGIGGRVDRGGAGGGKAKSPSVTRAATPPPAPRTPPPPLPTPPRPPTPAPRVISRDERDEMRATPAPPPTPPARTPTSTPAPSSTVRPYTSEGSLRRVEEAWPSATPTMTSVVTRDLRQLSDAFRSRDQDVPPPPRGPVCESKDEFFIGAGPGPRPTATPFRDYSALDVLKGGCYLAEKLDRVEPDPATVGSEVGMGKMVDDVARYSAAVTASTPIGLLAMALVYAAKSFRDYVATPYNFLCQQVEKEGTYYNAFPVDRIAGAAKDRWDEMPASQKLAAATIGVVTLVVAIAVLPP